MAQNTIRRIPKTGQNELANNRGQPPGAPKGWAVHAPLMTPIGGTLVTYSVIPHERLKKDRIANF